MTVEMIQTIPIFRIFGVEKAREFYAGFLGFTVDWEHPFEENMPVYMQVSRGSLVIHLSEHHGDCCPGSTILARVNGINEFHREVTSKGHRYMNPGIEDAPWDARVMSVIDPFGNTIRFYEDTAPAHES